MPYGLRKQGEQTCVYNTDTGKNVPGGCHASHMDALKHQRALMLNVPDAMQADIGMAMDPAECLQAAQDIVSNGQQLVAHHMGMMDNGSAEEQVTASLVAATAPVKPPLSYFQTPETDGPTPPTYEEDGRVYGHLALWDSCHRGFMGGAFEQCVKPPRSLTDYAQFHLGHVQTAEGENLPVGKITFDANHAPIQADLQAAFHHYDNTGSVGAYVRASNGRHGIWLSGVLRPGLSDSQVQTLRANPLSGDWRSLNRNLELVASLAVPVPGFPIEHDQLALAASADGGITALILPPAFTEEDDMTETEWTTADMRRKQTLKKEHEAVTAAVLTTQARKNLSRSDFALPATREYPIHDEAHARNALARSAGKPEAGRVRAAVCRKYPNMGECSDS